VSNVDRMTFPYLKRCLAKGRFYMVGSEIFLWTDLQNNIPEKFSSEVLGQKNILLDLKNLI